MGLGLANPIPIPNPTPTPHPNQDAFTGGLQDKVKASTKALNPTASGPRRPTMHESMFYTNVAGCLVALVLALLSGHLVGGVKFSIAQPEVLLPIVGTGPEARLLTGSIRPRPDRARGCGAAMILAQAPAPGSQPNPEQVLLAILLYSISSAVGQNSV